MQECMKNYPGAREVVLNELQDENPSRISAGANLVKLFGVEKLLYSKSGLKLSLYYKGYLIGRFLMSGATLL